jgi:hypothetical protein
MPRPNAGHMAAAKVDPDCDQACVDQVHDL